MKIKTLVRTTAILATVLSTGLVPGQPVQPVQPAWAGSKEWMKPGGWANPYTVQPDGPNRFEVKPSYPDPANPASMRPGSYLNPMVLERQSDGSYTVEPQFNFPNRSDRSTGPAIPPLPTLDELNSR